MQHLSTIAGALLGLAFIAFGAMFLLDMMPEQEPPPEGSPAALFMGAIVPTGFMAFVKVLEIAGGLLVAIPRTRNLGLLVLGPILVNIAAYHVFIGGIAGLKDPVVLVLGALALFLLASERRAFVGLMSRPDAA